MTHARQQIRDAAALALNGLTTTGPRVFKSRVRPLSDSKLPCQLVYTDEEQSTRLTQSNPATLQRNLMLQVRSVAKGSNANGELQDKLDTMAAEVEVALGNTTLGGLIKSISIIGSKTEMEEGDKPIGELEMTFNVVYMTKSDTPGTSI